MSGETEEKPSGWTTDTVLAYVQSQLVDLRRALDERYETQSKATEAAFTAQQTAMTTALAAAERAVATALLSAEKAVGKAEVASERRFESVNEFRAQLTDQAATFIRRDEADSRFRAITDKFDSESSRANSRINEIATGMNELELRLTSRLDLNKGSASGIADQSTRAIAVVGLILVVIGIGVTILLATRR